MYLKELHINGFKSFAQKSDLMFTTSISGIVGPNGSGKSNVAEAFRFVLGEQSLKNMRGKKGEDLIFTGEKGRMNRASVKVIFDNKDRNLDIDFKEVMIERVVARDGGNEYLINGTKVRAKDISELLSGANIGSSGHHIISQGEADKILSINPKERKGVIEEALGLKVFSIKKAEAERKLSKTQQNLDEVKTELRTTNPRITYLKKEVDKIEKAREMKEELRQLYLNYFPRKKKIQENLQVEIRKEQEITNAITKLDEKLEALRTQLVSVTEKSEVQKQVEELVVIEKKLQEVRTRKSELERTLGSTDARIEIEQEQRKKFDLWKQERAAGMSGTEEVARAIHTIWTRWAKKILASENISEERKARWEKKMTTYQSLGQSDKQEMQTYAEEVLASQSESELGLAPDFDEKKLVELQETKQRILKEIDLKTNEEQRLETTRDELDDIKDSSETVGQRVQIDILTIEKDKSESLGLRNTIRVSREQLEREIQLFNTEEAAARDMFGQETDSFFDGPLGEEMLNSSEKITRLKVLLENSSVGSSSELMDEYKKLVDHKEFIEKEMTDLEETAQQLNILIVDLSDQIEIRFREGMDKINSEFSRFFQTLFSGGKGEIFVTDIPIRKDNEDDPDEFETGVDISVALPNKKVRGLSMLSGGERSLTSIALLFAMSSVTPPPFIILDETDAALDEANSKRYGDMIELLAKESQLILITHNRETMSRAGILYGVTMGSDGASRLLSVSLDEAEAVAK